MALNRGYSSGKFAIELDGSVAGFLSSVEGGEVFGVVEETPDGAGRMSKQISAVGYEPITITFGAGMSDEFYDWVAELFVKTPTARSGAIQFLDYQLKERERLEWKNGFITEVKFPAFEGNSKDHLLITLTIAPDSTVLLQSSGKSQTGFGTKKQKQWSTSNFRFTVDSLEKATKKVAKIDALTFARSAERNVDGVLTPASLVVPNVVVTVPMADATPWLDWVDDFIVRGNNGDGAERAGSIELLDPTRKDTLFTLNLKQLGIVRARRQRTDANAEVIAKLEVELYCESVSFAYSPDVVTSDTTTEGGTGGTDSAPLVLAPLQLATDALLTLLLERGGEDVQRSLENVLRTESIAAAKPELRAKLIAARLRSASAPQPAERSPNREDGVALGERWASERAAFGELEQVAQLETGDWTALRLRDAHSLIGELQEAKLIPAGTAGAFELERDDFVEGVITGAANVLRQAAPHLKQ